MGYRSKPECIFSIESEALDAPKGRSSITCLMDVKHAHRLQIQPSHRNGR